MADDRDELRALEQGIDALAVHNLAFARELAERKRGHRGPPTLWVHVIHGTWANPASAKVRPTWSEPGGSLETALRTHGDAALWQRVRFAQAPTWSGRNSFAARAAAMAQLSDYFRGVLFDAQTTFDHHVIIAHSHGGTVAAEALRSLGSLAAEFSGLLTLGTPFVQRVCKAEEKGEVSFDSLTGFYAHAVAFFFAFTLALFWLLEARFWLSAACAVLGLVPAVLAKFARLSVVAGGLSAAMPVLAMLVWWWLGYAAVGGLLNCAFVASLATLGLATHMPARHAVRFLGFNDGAAEDELPAPLQTPLLAIRAPGDEASLAISAASGAVFLSDTFHSIGLQTLRSIPGWIYGGLGATLALSVAALLLWPGNALWTAVFAVSASLPIVVPVVALTVALVLKFGATLLIALACGREALEAPGMTKVFAEPLPRSKDALDAPATLRMVFPSHADLQALRRKATLRHSVYEYPSVQEHVAHWVLHHVVPAKHD